MEVMSGERICQIVWRPEIDEKNWQPVNRVMDETGRYRKRERESMCTAVRRVCTQIGWMGQSQFVYCNGGGSQVQSVEVLQRETCLPMAGGARPKNVGNRIRNAEESWQD